MGVVRRVCASRDDDAAACARNLRVARERREPEDLLDPPVDRRQHAPRPAVAAPLGRPGHDLVEVPVSRHIGLSNANNLTVARKETNLEETPPVGLLRLPERERVRVLRRIRIAPPLPLDEHLPAHPGTGGDIPLPE